MTNVKETENRTVVIRNFRNLGPFCPGIGEDCDKNKVILKLNRSLAREELGGLVILIGENNCGKTNLIDALSKYRLQLYDEDDCPDFLPSDGKKPSVRINVADGRYGADGKEFVTIYSGYIRHVLLALAMEKATYDTYSEKNDCCSFDDYQYNVWCSYSDLIEFRTEWSKSDLRSILSDREDHVGSELIRKLDEGTYRFNSEDYICTIPSLDELHYDCIRFDENDERLLSCRQTTFADDLLAWSCIAVALSNVSISKVPNLKSTADRTFEKAYGYILSEKIDSYDCYGMINQDDLSCELKFPNKFFSNLFGRIGCSEDDLENLCYADEALRIKLEKEMNAELKCVADEFNDFIGAERKKYSFSVKIGARDIEFIITCGNNIPLMYDSQSGVFRWLFEFFFDFFAVKKVEPGDIILIDGFMNSLCLKGIVKFRNKMREYARKNGVTVLMTARNPMAVDIAHLDEVRLMIPEDDGSSRIINDFDEFSEEDNDVIGPVINGLMIGRNFMRTENRRTVFVEDTADYFYLSAFCDVFGSRGDTVDIDFIPLSCMGKYKDNPEQALRQIKAIERQPLVIINTDKGTEKFIKDAKEKGICLLSISEIFDGTKKKIEDLFSEKDAGDFGILPRSFDRAACFSHRLPEYYDSMSNETKANFKKIADFIKSR